MIGWLVDERGIEPHVKLMVKSARTDGTFSRCDFAFDPQGNLYVCPAGKELKKYHRSFPKPRRRSDQRRHEDLLRAAASRTATPARSSPSAARTCLHARSRALFMQAARDDKARAIAKTEAYAVSRRERKKVEMLFAHHEAHPWARSIAPPRSKRSQRRIPLSRHRPKSAKTGEAYPPPCADPRHIRRRGRNLPR